MFMYPTETEGYPYGLNYEGLWNQLSKYKLSLVGGLYMNIALRFRDLIANTIPEHQAVITSNGYVWWGWWGKPEENFPVPVIQQLNQAILQDNLVVFLVDSGNSHLYRAKVNQIAFDNNQLLQSPEQEKTPEYYRNSNNKAWFKITGLERLPSAEIKKWSYTEAEGFCDDTQNAAYHGKRVYDLAEMLNRKHRTVYFLNPYNPATDRAGEITTEEQRPNGQSIENFSTNPIFCKSNYIIHLSDLHFGAGHNYPLKNSRTTYSLLYWLGEDIKQYNRPPAAVIISGDLTSVGNVAEYTKGLEFLEGIKSVTGLSSANFIIVPGNHDIQWARQTGDFNRSKQVTAPPATAERKYKDFYKKFYGCDPNEYFSMGRRFMLDNYITVDVLGINSCRLEQRHFAGYGFIGQDQLSTAVRNMGWKDEQNPSHYRVAVLHHHVIPVVASEIIDSYDAKFSLSLDSGQFMYSCLENQVDLVLHGHQHQSFSSTVTRALKGSSFAPNQTLNIHGTGSVGAKRDAIPHAKNMYSVYEIAPRKISVTVRATSETAQKFDIYSTSTLLPSPQGGLYCYTCE